MSLLRTHAEPPAADGSITLTLAGELDSYSCESLRDWLADAAAQRLARVEVDLRDVTFIDSGGIAALLAGTKWLRRVDGDVVLRNPTPAAMRVFEITGLHKVFTIEP